MEIELLSKMLCELLPVRKTVSLPGLGEFVSVPMPASFSDRGRTIMPPYVKVYFKPGSSNDGVLTEMYASNNDIEIDAASSIILNYLKGLKEELYAKGTLVFPSLGTLRLTRRGDFLFIQDDELDIFPDYFGLKPVSLRTASEIPDTASEAVEEDKQIPEPVRETKSEPVREVEPEKKEKKTAWVGIVIALAILCLVLAIFAALGRLAPELVDHILYSAEDYKILHP